MRVNKVDPIQNFMIYDDRIVSLTTKKIYIFSGAFRKCAYPARSNATSHIVNRQQVTHTSTVLLLLEWELNQYFKLFLSTEWKYFCHPDSQFLCLLPKHSVLIVGPL